MKNKFSIVFSLLFHTIFYLYILLLIKPELIYHHQQLGFSFDKYSLAEYLTYPGGLAECASLFLFQFNTNSFSGALLYTVLTFLIIFLAGKIIAHYQPFSLYYILKYLPGIIIAGLLTNYSFHTTFVFTVLLLLLFFYAFINILMKLNSVVVQIISFIFLSGLTYYISGGLAFLIFSFSSFIYILSKKEARSIVFTTVLVIITIFIPFLASKLVFFNTIKNAYFNLIPQYHYYEPDVLLYSIYFYLPFMLLVLVIIRLIKSRDEIEAEGPKRTRTGLFFQTLVIIAGFCAIIYFNFQKEDRHKISVDYYSYYKQWDKILEIVKQNPSDDRLIQFHTNRALYHTGQLSQSMFDYPQVWGVTDYS
jgi:hypothetical protein